MNTLLQLRAVIERVESIGYSCILVHEATRQMCGVEMYMYGKGLQA